MSIYELTQALKRYRVPVSIAFGVLFFIVLLMTFTFRDGKPAFRAGESYESSVQIAVVPPGTDSLIESENSTADLGSAANLYASLLSSSEAALWIGEQNGYTPEDVVSTNVERGSSVIVATVEAPTLEQAKAAALSTFDWLNMRLQQPVETASFPTPPTTVPLIFLDGPFVSYLNVEAVEGLVDAPIDLFLSVQPDENEPTILSLQQSAGRTIRTRAQLNPFGTIVLSVRFGDGEPQDTIRVAPPTAPRAVEYVPELLVTVDESAIDYSTGEGGREASLDQDGIVITWIEGNEAAEAADENTVDVDLALLTTEPGVVATGGRRGPILFVSALLVGTVLILTAVIVVDIWRRQREEAEGTASPASDASVMTIDTHPAAARAAAPQRTAPATSPPAGAAPPVKPPAEKATAAKPTAAKPAQGRAQNAGAAAKDAQPKNESSRAE